MKGKVAEILAGCAGNAFQSIGMYGSQKRAHECQRLQLREQRLSPAAQGRSLMLSHNRRNVPFAAPPLHCRKQANVFTFVDRAERSTQSGTFFSNAGQPPSQYWFTIPGERDRACGANVAFADGHAEFHKWRYLRRIRMELRTYFTNEADRADLIWVLSRVPDASGR